ncbi:tubulin monoglycylase TTLL3-like isoform X1 [Anguilla rostrata]|uniref:tubulin monoglycylase TTLL3-like isoform X1 n=1 Tax=Anguilla rostrata TaxID=7938 RepID=UPI0030CB05CE
MRPRDHTEVPAQRASLPAPAPSPASAPARAERSQNNEGKVPVTDKGSLRGVIPQSGNVNLPYHLRQTSSTPSPERTTQSVPEGKVRRSITSLPVITSDRLSRAKALVEKAVKQRKVFSVHGPYPVLRAALRARGWVEQRQPRNVPSKGRTQGDEGDDRDNSTDGEDSSEEVERDDTPDDIYDIMSRLVRNETVYFCWTMRRDTIDYRSLRKEQITNHFAKVGTFTTKVGLCVNLRNLRWFDAADPDTFFPRCYRLGAEDEKYAFIDDYRRTACSSLLQCVLERSRGEQVEEERAGSSDFSGQKKRCKRRAIESVGSGIIDSALLVCQDFLDTLEHNDIDISMETPPSLTEQQWAEFLHSYYMIVHEGVGIRDSNRYLERCQVMLRRLREVSPQLDTDGIHNIWIVKPGALSRGRGIICVKRLEEILKLVDSDPALIKDSKWVVQKYLERPLLIHGTKFDLRQWFLVTDWNPLTIWFYRECYLRFSTQPYSVERLDSSVHLCNNSIQKHYQPSQRRHPEIPEDNMWSSEQFRTFLRVQGQVALWDSVVVPGMKQAVVHALQTAQDLVESRRGSFELYGADFMLGRDLRPWLIEINGSPTMAPSTPVTAQLCMAVQEDTLRVVLDRRLNRSACTGGFQLIYKQAAVEIPQYVGVSLFVEGAPLRRPRLRPRRKLTLPKAVHIPRPRTDQSKEAGVEKVGGAEAKTAESAKKPVKSRQSSRQKPHVASKRCPTGKRKENNTDKERKGPGSAQNVPRQAAHSLKLIPVCPILTAEPKHSDLGLSSGEKPRLPPRALSRSMDSSLRGSARRRQVCHSCTTRSMLLSPCGLPTLRSPAPLGGSRGLHLGPLDVTATTPPDPPTSNTSPPLQPLLPNVCRQSTPTLSRDTKRKSL